MYMILYDPSTCKIQNYMGTYGGMTPIFTEDKHKVANFLNECTKVKVYKLDNLTEISSAEIKLLEATNA